MKTGIAKKDNTAQVLEDKANAKAMQSGKKSAAQEAFNQLYKRYKSSIFFMALKAVKMDEEVAKDLTQEIFAKVFEKIKQYNYSTAFSTWLYNVAGNHIIDFKRKEKYEVLSIESLGSTYGADEDVTEIAFQLHDKENNTFAQLVRQENAQMVHLALAKVSSEAGREVMNLIFLQGLPYAETAEQMNMPVGTVKALMMRAKSEMGIFIKEYLKKENFDVTVDYGKSCRLSRN